MNQNESNEVELYLNQVSEQLSHLPDKEDILIELRQHIFDMANELSLTKQFTVSEAFREAIDRMENPQVIAEKFISMESSDSSESYKGVGSKFTTQNYAPERRITNEQFAIMGLIGLVSVLLFSPIISFSLSSGEFLPFIFGLSFVTGLVIIIFFLLFMYYQDEKTRNAQIAELRKRFQKVSSQFQSTKNKYPASWWSKFWEHAAGIGNLWLVILASAAVIYLTFWLPYPNLFNDNWFYIGFIIVIISLIVEASTAIFTIALGRVRILRLMKGMKHFLLAVLALVLLIYYPLTLSDAIIEFLPANIDLRVLNFFENIDFYAKILLGIIASIHWMTGLYDLFKYGFWKPSDRQSLLSE
ncbi:MAG: hypothetical protein ACW981_05230 [Candidatus Hodarchaeales archaeon]|jgi:uncharacterized membrane protein